MQKITIVCKDENNVEVAISVEEFIEMIVAEINKLDTEALANSAKMGIEHYYA